MDGLINLYKPQAITSAKAVYRVRRITRVRKSGHAGSLDPVAEGVLLICLGGATKLVERLMDLPKVYRASARLDVTSDSHDSEGPVTPVDVPVVPTRGQIQALMPAFEGRILQVPPRFSALKVEGLPAYRRARGGEDVAMPARPAVVYWLHLVNFAWPVVTFEMACGRGTYVRAIVRDMGLALSTGGCLTELVRTRVGPFQAESAWTLETLDALRDPLDAVVPLEATRTLLEDPAFAAPPPRPGTNPIP